MQGLAGHGKELELYSKYNVKSLKDVNQRFSMVQVTFLKDYAGVMWRILGKGEELEIY